MYANHDITAEVLVPQDSFAQSAWASARISNRLDSEMAALLRMYLFGVFSKANDWGKLNTRLRDKGFYLKRSGTHLWLRDCHSHVEICTCRFLGFPSVGLEMRLGPIGQQRQPSSRGPVSHDEQTGPVGARSWDTSVRDEG
jgi:hypothetical protein